MQVVIRNYQGEGLGAFFDFLETRKAEIETLLRGVPGFVSYVLARNDQGGFSVTLCNDQAGIDKSTQMVKDWVAKNAGNLAKEPPKLSMGKVIVHLK